jgi:hypothetical protein
MLPDHAVLQTGRPVREAARYLPDTSRTRPPIRGRQWPRYLHDTPACEEGHHPPVATSFAVVFAPTDAREAGRARGAETGGAALSGGVGGAQRRGHGDRRGPLPRGWSARRSTAGWVGIRSPGGRVGRLDVAAVSPPDGPRVEAQIVELRRQHPGWGPGGDQPVTGQAPLHRRSPRQRLQPFR